MALRIALVISLFAFLSLAAVAAMEMDGDIKGAAAPEPKRFTLQAEKVSRSQALAELARQTGIRVEDLRGAPDQTIRLDLKRATFWQALDALAAATETRVNISPTSGRIALESRGPSYRPPPVSYDGRFRLSAKKVTASRNLEFRDNDPHRGACNVTVEVAWEPELQPLFLETRPHGLRLVDDTGKTWPLPDEGSSLAPLGGCIALALDVSLPALPRSVAQIRSLEGELSMIGPSKMLTFHFDKLSKLAQANENDPERLQSQENVTCRISKVTLDRDHWSVRVVLDYPGGLKQLDSHQSWVVNNDLVLESGDGKKRMPSTHYAVVSVSPRRAVLVYHFLDQGGRKRGNPSEWRLSYRTPASLIEAPIKFAFKNIPLP